MAIPRLARSLRLLVIVLAVSSAALCLAQAKGKQPKLLPETQTPAPAALVQKLLNANAFWLHPPVKRLIYTFQMQQLQRTGKWGASVDFQAPDQATVTMDGGKTSTLKAGPGELHSAMLQGFTFYGPLQAFSAAPDHYKLTVVGQDTVDGKAADVLQMRSTGKASPEEIARLKERYRMLAVRPTYPYQFLPVEKTVNGKKTAVMEIKCLKEEGPGWADIQAAYKQNQSEIKWGGEIISAQVRDFLGKKRPVIVINRDPDFKGKSPITATIFSTGFNNMTDDLTLGEGPRVVDQAILDRLVAQAAQSIHGAVGCGIFQTWYGYSSFGSDVDQVWVDRATGSALREEMYRGGKCAGVVSYGDFEDVGQGSYAPRHVVVTLLGDSQIYPWVFDATMTTVDGKAWLMRKLQVTLGSEGPTARAETSGIIVGLSTSPPPR